MSAVLRDMRRVRFAALPPLSLYVHLPWCVKKCPYCDFNSHEKDAQGGRLPDSPNTRRGPGSRPGSDAAVGVGAAPSFDLHRRRHAEPVPGRRRSMRCSRRCARALPVEPDAEITLEANPGTAEAARFRGYRDAGVNRAVARRAELRRRHAQGARSHPWRGRGAARDRDGAGDFRQREHRPDVRPAGPDAGDGARRHRGGRAAWARAHLSAYQLTLEPNTVFFSHPPKLPGHDAAADMQLDVEEALRGAGFEHYETSAFARPGRALPAQPQLLGVRRLPRNRCRRARQAQLCRPGHAP